MRELFLRGSSLKSQKILTRLDRLTFDTTQHGTDMPFLLINQLNNVERTQQFRTFALGPRPSLMSSTLASNHKPLASDHKIFAQEKITNN